MDMDAQMKLDIAAFQKQMVDEPGRNSLKPVSNVDITIQGHKLSPKSADFLWLLIYEGWLQVARDLMPPDEDFSLEMGEVITASNLKIEQPYIDLEGQRENAMKYWE